MGWQGALRLMVMGVLCMLAACQSANFAPVHERQSPPLHRPDHYRVTSGDTLYSIAFRYGLDVRGLARANRIARPYTIFPGQQLVLREASAPPITRKPAPPKPVAPAVKQPPVATANKPTPVTKAPATQPQVSANKPVVNEPVADKPVGRWLWPTEGKVVRRFTTGRRVHNGIDINGRSGQPVLATADGTVVYAGDGLVGYGNLLIIKHNETFLSAYGHNKKLLVKEGDKVSQGHRIATMGDSGTTSVKLHFEIRQNGRPIDPLRLVSQ